MLSCSAREISNYNAQIFESLTEMSTLTERSKDPHDPAAYKALAFGGEIPSRRPEQIQEG